MPKKSWTIMKEMDGANAMDGTGEAGNPLGDLGQAQIICVIGGPGVGKGTQCTKLASDLRAAHVSVGDLLRKEASKVLEKYEIDILAHMRDGKLVPKNIVQGVLEDELLLNIKAGKTRILLDGFPRSMDQMDLFEASGCNIKAVLWFDGSKETLLGRMLNRSKTSGRVDDTEAIFEKRYQGFLDDSEDIIRFAEQKKTLVKVDCDQDLEEIYEGTMELVKRIFFGERKEGESLEIVHEEARSQT